MISLDVSRSSTLSPSLLVDDTAIGELRRAHDQTLLLLLDRYLVVAVAVAIANRWLLELENEGRALGNIHPAH